MGKKHFTDEEVTTLSINPYIKHVSNKAITYEDSFKKFFITEYDKGTHPSKIFKLAGFDTKILGLTRISSFSKMMKRIKERPEGITDTRSTNSGRIREKEYTVEDEIKSLKHKIKVLEEENRFFKNMRFLNKMQAVKAMTKKS